MNFFEQNKRERIGPVAQKILIFLAAGACLSMTRRPDHYFRIIKSAAKEWDKINKRSLREAIKRLYQSKMVDYKENNDDTVTLVLSENGKKRSLRYDLEKMKLQKSSRWDGLWRIVMFDIPEHKKQARDALARKCRSLGFYPIQKSVLVYPYDCKEEIEFISEVFEVKQYVRFILAKDIDTALDLKHKFDLI